MFLTLLLELYFSFMLPKISSSCSLLPSYPSFLFLVFLHSSLLFYCSYSGNSTFPSYCPIFHPPALCFSVNFIFHSYFSFFFTLNPSFLTHSPPPSLHSLLATLYIFLLLFPFLSPYSSLLFLPSFAPHPSFIHSPSPLLSFLTTLYFSLLLLPSLLSSHFSPHKAFIPLPCSSLLLYFTAPFSDLFPLLVSFMSRIRGLVCTEGITWSKKKNKSKDSAIWCYLLGRGFL